MEVKGGILKWGGDRKKEPKLRLYGKATRKPVLGNLIENWCFLFVRV